MKDKKNGTVVVEVGDTLWGIAEAFDTDVDTLMKLNSDLISDPNVITPGMTIKVTGEVKNNNSKTVTIVGFGVQVNTTRTMFVAWEWGESENTENYQVVWRYQTGDVNNKGEAIWYDGSDSTTTNGDTKQSVYNAPENAKVVYVKIKPNMKSGSSNGTSTSTEIGWASDTYNFSKNPPLVPSAPTVTINKYKLTVELDTLNMNASHVEFEIIRDNEEAVGDIQLVEIAKYDYVSYSCNITAGSIYKVRCRSVRDGLRSEWSPYSSSYKAMPIATTITECNVLSKNSVQIKWDIVNSADGYEIEYTTKKEYFNQLGGEVYSDRTTNNVVNIYNLATGSEYFIRVRAISNESEASDWSEIRSFIVGTTSTAPTTWSSTNNVMINEPLNLYWIHNSKDGSSQTWAQLEIVLNGVPTTYTIENTKDEEEKDKTSVYSFSTDDLADGGTIEWRVRTAGVLTDDNDQPAYGDWSIVRTVKIYAPPVFNEFILKDYNHVNLRDYDEKSKELTSFPFYLSCSIGNTANQDPTGYYITIVSNETYTTVNNVGNDKTVGEGSIVYSKYISSTETSMDFEFTAKDVDLEYDVKYTINVTASMDSGLTANSSKSFIVRWIEETYTPFAEIGIDKNNMTAIIRPYSNGGSDVLLSVYRREFDGSFLEIAVDIENGKNTFVSDPHPSLDYARYRIVAKDKATGAISFNDVYTLVGGKSIIIQWDEQWQDFEIEDDYVTEERPWSGSMLVLPYNIDVSDSYSPDVSLVKYIGRKHPVSYYGTYQGHTSTWSTAIPKYDKETLHAIRRLAAWMGDVYVREPSGTGYWANITVSYNQTHLETIIPITFNVKRVEGGV